MNRESKIIRTSFMGIGMNIVLVIFKVLIGLISNSIAILLDAVNNFTDAVSAIVTIIGTKLSNRAADKEHPYGHGRIEYISSAIIALIIYIAGIVSCTESIEKIYKPADVNYSISTLLIIIVAVLVKYCFSKYIKKIGKEIDSQSLIATGQDCFMDSILSFSTFVAAIISIGCKINLEGWFGVFISFFIFKSAIDILRETADSIVGKRADSELTKKLKAKINSYTKVQGTYEIILHNYGPSYAIGSANIQVDDKMTAKEIHQLTKKIQIDIYNEFNIVITLGIYALNTANKKYKLIKEELNCIIKEYPEILQIYGFYVDDDSNTISFDMIIDFSVKNPNKIKSDLISKIKKVYPNYVILAIVDRDICD